MGMRSSGSDSASMSWAATFSSLGGDGWVPRPGTHRDEVWAGQVWRRCGYRSEVAPLREVMITAPPESIGAVIDARASLMREPVDLAAIRDQADGIAEAFRGNGVVVRVAQPPPTAPPNVLFMRDLFLMTPEGAIIGRMASAQRAGEERHAAYALAAHGYPILSTVSGTATFEAADALWIDAQTVVVGVGFRTNAAGAREVRRVLRGQGVEVVTVPLVRGVQHLLGAIVFLDERLAVVHPEAVPGALRKLLLHRGYQLVELEANDDLLHRRGMNLVTVAPRVVIMPGGAPTIRRALHTAGVQVQEVDVGEYLKADGALGCLTGIVHRDR